MSSKPCQFHTVNLVSFTATAVLTWCRENRGKTASTCKNLSFSLVYVEA